MLILENINKVYWIDMIEILVFNNISLIVGQGEFFFIMGFLGCGKSILFNIMGLIDEFFNGRVMVVGQSIVDYNSKVMVCFCNQYLGFIFQSFYLINDFLVIDNVELLLLYCKVGGKECCELVEQVLEQVGFKNWMCYFFSQLLGGQKQWVVIVCVIVGCLDIILVDEFIGNLDSVMGNEIMDILLCFNELVGIIIVMVMYDECMVKWIYCLVCFFDGSQV